MTERPSYKWWVFGTVATGVFVSVMDQSGVTQALPRIASHFNATIPEVQWVVLGYILTTGSLLLPMGRLSDIVGRKIVYASGQLVFTLGALLAGLSTSLVTVVLFKAFQGIGASMSQATAMAIATSAFPGNERGKIIGLFMTAVGLGAIFGPIVGGGVVSLMGWRYVFFLGVPFGLMTTVAALTVLEGRPASSPGTARRSPGFDWLGAALSAGALATFLLVLSNAHRVGWVSPPILVGFAAMIALAVSFVWWELRCPSPMLPLGLFRRRLFSIGISSSFISFLGNTPVFFLMPFYLQGILGYSPAQAGLSIAPAAVAFAITGPIAGRLSDKFGWRVFAVTGLAITAASLFMLSRLAEGASIGLIGGLILMQGVGMGLVSSPITSAVLSTVERNSYGIVTALLNMVRNTANLSGLALATFIVTATMGSLGYEPSLDAVKSVGGEGVKAAFTSGLTRAFFVAGSLVTVALVISTLRVRHDTVGSPDLGSLTSTPGDHSPAQQADR